MATFVRAINLDPGLWGINTSAARTIVQNCASIRSPTPLIYVGGAIIVLGDAVITQRKGYPIFRIAK